MNAMKFFLSRFRDELDIECEDWELFGSVFPELLDADRSKNSRREAASRYGNHEPRTLLPCIKKSTRLPKQHEELIETIDVVVKASQKGRVTPTDALGRLTRRSREKTYAGIFESNLAVLVREARLYGGDFDRVSAPFLALFSQEETKKEITKHLREIWDLARKGNEDIHESADYAMLWRWCIHDVAKDQLVRYVRSLIVDGYRLRTVLGYQTVKHYADGWNKSAPYIVDDDEDAEDFRRGLGFVLSRDFLQEYAEMLRRTFPDTDSFSKNDFLSELKAIGAEYDDGDISDEAQLKAMVDAVTMCILAALVGPGSFARELGRPLPGEVDTVSGRQLGAPALMSVGCRLQPVVLTGENSDSYFTDQSIDAARIDKKNGNAIRVGRSADWLAEVTSAIRLTDSRVSRRHAEIFRSSGKWKLRDLETTYGTLVIRAAPHRPIALHSSLDEEGLEITLRPGDIIVPGAFSDDGTKIIPIGSAGRALRFEVEYGLDPLS